MILNGIDLVKIERFMKLKENPSFMHSIFQEEELEYIHNHNDNLATIAGIFASKEAFLKAIKKGIDDYSLKDIHISHDSHNAPFILLENRLKEDISFQNISLSISHDGEYAIAMVSILF